VRVKSDVYPLKSIASLEVISTGSSWCVELRTTDGAMRRLGFSPAESSACELLERIETARTALLNWKPEPAPVATADADAATRIDGQGR